MEDMQFHPAANIFPMMAEADFSGLVEDIGKHGLREPIGLLHGKIIDGRNRYRACLQASVEPEYSVVETDDPVAYVLSLNLHRRHLSPSQVAMVGGRARDLYDEAAKARMNAGKGGDGSGGRGHKKNPPVNVSEGLGTGDARDKAGKAVGVSGSLIDRATKVLKEGTPELIQAVDSGKMSVSRAAEVTDLEPEEQASFADSYIANRGRFAPEKKSNGTAPNPGYVKTERFAIEAARCAITQLGQIPGSNPGRDKAFSTVEEWIAKQRKKA